MPFEFIHETRLRSLYGGVCTVQTPLLGTPAGPDRHAIQRGLYGTNPLRGDAIRSAFERLPYFCSSPIPVRLASSKERFHGQ